MQIKPKFPRFCGSVRYRDAGRILHNKMGHLAVHEYLQTLRRWYKVKRREAPSSQPTCSSGVLWSVGCTGGAKTRLSSVITQNKCAQNCGHYLPYQLYLLFYSWANVTARHFPGCPPSTQYQPITIP